MANRRVMPTSSTLKSFGAATCVATLVNCLAWAQPIAEISEHLRPPSAFSGISDRAARSRALFAEAAKVITSPPAGKPASGSPDWYARRATRTRIFRSSAPQATRAFPVIRDGDWHPSRWHGREKRLREICRQIKDPARNGGRSLALLHEHMAKDDLVGWAWHPGPGRRPAPGTQEEFDAIITAWIESGAECP
jgi:hypothetical protein